VTRRQPPSCRRPPAAAPPPRAPPPRAAARCAGHRCWWLFIAAYSGMDNRKRMDI